MVSALARAAVAAAVSVGMADALSVIQRDFSALNETLDETGEWPGPQHDKAGGGGSNGKKNKDKKDDEPKCKRPGQLLFLHIQSNAGTSIEDYVSCKAKRNTAKMKLALGPDAKQKEYFLGETKKCDKPTVCSTKGRYIDREKDCGYEFHSPSTFTIMRDPVDRVFSFYNKAKIAAHESGSKYEFPPIEDLMRDCVYCKTYDKPCDPAPRDDLCKGVINHMTFQTFARNEHRYQVDLDHKGQVMVLKQAIDVMHNLKSVFFTDDLDKFDRIFMRENLLNDRDEIDKDRDCKVKWSEKTVCPPAVCHHKPTFEEAKAIKKFNYLDVRLYEHAREAPNRVKR